MVIHSHADKFQPGTTGRSRPPPRPIAQLRACVHCGFCTATCPTYLLLGDELDSPRGRIYPDQGDAGDGRRPAPTTVTHLDRCLSCLSCMTTCPSGVNYMHLVDHARAYIEEHKVRPLAGTAVPRRLCCGYWQSRALFRAGAAAGGPGASVRGAAAQDIEGDGGAGAAQPCRRKAAKPGPACLPRKGQGAPAWRCCRAASSRCWTPAIDAAVVRLLTRHGVEMVVAQGQGCCGALAHHMGDDDDALAQGQNQYRRLGKGNRRRRAGRDRDFGLGLRHGAEELRLYAARTIRHWAARAARISALCQRRHRSAGRAGIESRR